MKQDKDLLLKDLCARLPYQPLCKKVDTEDDFCECDAPLGYSLRDLVDNKIIIKPYLRPMSSMTEEEMDELESITFPLVEKDWDGNENPACVRLIDVPKYMNFILSNHFDFMGLIPKGLAIEVTEENNPYKN